LGLGRTTPQTRNTVFPMSVPDAGGLFNYLAVAV
jgi:hypothetical protein